MSDTNSYDSALKEFVADSDQRGNNGHRSDRTAFDGLIDARHGPIGRVVASEREPSGAHIFHFWAGEEQRSLDVGHIIVGFSEDAAVIGVVDEPRRYSDLVSFLDDFYDRHLEQDLAAEPPTRRPEILVFRVNVLRTRHTREDVTSRRPVVAGPVYFATTDAIDFALGRADFDGEAIPALLHTNGNAERNESGDIHLSADGNAVFQRSPIWIDEEYLLGPEAGHANWTGQSGLATKTSHALFLTSAIFQRMEAQGSSIAALLFNVKGPDLLWLDKSIVPDTEDERTRFATHGLEGLSPLELSAYEGMGLNPAPFEHVRVFAPFKPGQQPANQNVVHLSGSEFHGRLNTLRDDPGERHKVYPVLWGLKPLLFMPHKVFDRGDLDDKMFGLIADMRDREQIVSLRQMEQRLREIVSDLDESGGTEWNGHHKFTVLKALNRFNGLENKFAGLLTDGEVDYGSLPQVDETFTNQEVRVVDIANCNTNVQELLVTSAINEVWKRAERQELGVDKLIIFVDELNKHAAAGSESALRNTLVDIAARGRHLNVVLFGAQQFRSKVDDEILGIAAHRSTDGSVTKKLPTPPIAH